MNRAISKYKMVKDTKLFIEVEGSPEVYVNSGDEVKKGDKLYSVERKKILESHYLPKALGISVEKSSEYVGRVGGEYVMEGELLAEKLTSGGLVTKRLIAGADGIVSLKRLDKGYIDILSEADRVNVSCPVNGLVDEVVLNSGIYIRTDAVKVELFDVEGFENAEHHPEVTGILHSVVKDSQVPAPSNLEQDYEGKIVFVGQHFHRQLITELYKRGCEAIVAYSADVSLIVELSIPVVLLKGYGHIQKDEDYYKLIEKNEGEWVKIDLRDKSIYIFDSAVKPKEVKDRFVATLKEKASVSSHDIDTFGLSGKCLEGEVEDDKYAIVASDGGGQGVLIRKESLVLN